MSTDTALLAAGAVLPGASAGADRDDLLARRYEHPALEDRVVVRLVAGVLAEAEDLTAEYLGFAAPVSSARVGTARRVALGFPAWALVHDPANAHHALALVKEIERLDRVAKSKAGAAKDGFTELAAMLGRSAPHFLPTFFEEAARIFLRHGNANYAATMFSKAREAEQVHDLTVDPDRVRAVFLEFAFAGVLPAKTLSAYAKELARRYPPVEAYERFRTLCVERVKGGLPPHAGMPEDLRRLVKAAKLDARVEDEQVLRAILDTSAVAHAAAGFWKSYRDALIALAETDPEARSRLLVLVPRRHGTLEPWLDIITTGGATALLTGSPEPTAPATLTPPTLTPPAPTPPTLTPPAPAPPTPARWLSEVIAARWADWRTPERTPALLDLVETMAERLVADGEPVSVVARRDDVELDLLDLLLANGVPVTTGEVPLDMNLRAWLSDNTPGRRDLTAVAGSALAERLGAEVFSYLRIQSRGGVADAALLRGALEVPGLRAALKDWITVRAASPGRTVIALGATLRELAVLGIPEAFVDAPEAADSLAAVDVESALQHTLRAGLLDEIGWDALDQAVVTFPIDKDGKRAVEVVGEGWPALVLGRESRIVVAGPDGVLAEHLAQIPAEARATWHSAIKAAWFDSALITYWHGPEKNLAYWSDDPRKHFTPGELSAWGTHAITPSVALPGGGRFTGKRAIHPGDTHLSEPRMTYGDGATVWCARWGNGWEWFQVDPTTGVAGRASLPAFLDDFTADGAQLELVQCDLRPTAPGTESSPLGAAGGLHGWRLRREQDGSWTGEGIDGRRVRSTSAVSGLLEVPGGRLAVVRSHRVMTVHDADDTPVATVLEGDNHPDYAAGTPMVVPFLWWHLLRPRDTVGSAALRGATIDAVRIMLAAAVAEIEADTAPDNQTAYSDIMADKRDTVATAVLRALPGLSHPALLAGVVGVVRAAARHQVGLRAFADLAVRAKELGDWLGDTAPVVTDHDVNTALNWFGHFNGGRQTGAAATLPVVIDALRAAAARPTPVAEGLPELTSTAWLTLLPHLGALAHRAASPLAAEDERSALGHVLRWTADSTILDQPGQWRTLAIKVPDNDSFTRHSVIPVAGGFLNVVEGGWYGRHATGIQFTANPGSFAMPSGWTVEREEVVPTTLDRGWIHRFLDNLATHGPLPWREEAVAELVEATGMGTAEAAYLLAGMPGVTNWGKTFLSTQDRALLGLSAPAANAARERMKGLKDDVRGRLLAALAPVDPDDLWTTGPDVAAAARVWNEVFGRSRPVDDAILVEAAKLLVQSPVEHVVGLLNPAGARVLTTDAVMRHNGRHLVSQNPDGFTLNDLDAIPRVLLWLAQRLPAGSAHRATLPEALALARQRAAHPDFGITFSSLVGAAEVQALLGVDLPEPDATASVREWLDVHGSRHTIYFTVWPGRVGPQDRELLVAIAEISTSRDFLAVWDLLASDGLAAACAVPPQGGPDAYFQDPTFSVPHLVNQVVERHNLDPDAAAIYLQLLALPDPTDANVARWTGWKPARLRKARTALAETDLVLTAKRARAGRSLFLPGGWLALPTPHVPLETWKAPMFGFTDIPTRVIAAREPITDLFTRAWQRVLDDDAPAYEEIRTGRRR
ncbi:hypothetical protein [Actinokineospora diospyrosa]|uniref:DNA-binding protein n=1 Tax=Actinokineospora diospyrosa TaxID=103728 RepID=A0ABT1IFI1_9PSEU|nr:hypothetical protein [Actinokineospora diospyrosa]MCP2271338.1 hypothetical protein [Actinokineospora diospyrosa]